VVLPQGFVLIGTEVQPLPTQGHVVLAGVLVERQGTRRRPASWHDTSSIGVVKSVMPRIRTVMTAQ
jgi:hypothetical protein